MSEYVLTEFFELRESPAFPLARQATALSTLALYVLKCEVIFCKSWPRDASSTVAAALSSLAIAD